MASRRDQWVNHGAEARLSPTSRGRNVEHDRALLELATGVSAEPLPAGRPPGNATVLGYWLVRRVDAGQPLALAIAELLDRFPILVDATDAPGQRPAVRELRRLDAYQDAVANLERYYHRERKRMGWPAGTNGGQRRDQ